MIDCIVPDDINDLVLLLLRELRRTTHFQFKVVFLSIIFFIIITRSLLNDFRTTARVRKKTVYLLIFYTKKIQNVALKKPLKISWKSCIFERLSYTVKHRQGKLTHLSNNPFIFIIWQMLLFCPDFLVLLLNLSDKWTVVSNISLEIGSWGYKKCCILHPTQSASKCVWTTCCHWPFLYRWQHKELRPKRAFFSLGRISFSWCLQFPSKCEMVGALANVTLLQAKKNPDP